MAVLVLVVLILAFSGHSDASWCVCRSDVSDSALQKSLDYACGAGADCTPISQNGPCFQPNTVRAHCSYAVNSYFQKKGQTPQSCDFSTTATVSSTDPSPGGSCSFPSSATPSTGTTTPTTGGLTPSTGTTPTMGGGTTPSTTIPGGTTGGTGTGGGTGMGTGGTGTGTGTGTGFTPGSGIMPGSGIGGGLGPTGSGINTDNSDGGENNFQKGNLFPLMVTLWFSGLILWWG